MDSDYLNRDMSPLPQPSSSRLHASLSATLVTSSPRDTRLHVIPYCPHITKLKFLVIFHHPLKWLVPPKKITIPFIFNFIIRPYLIYQFFWWTKSSYLIVYLSNRLNLRLANKIVSEIYHFNWIGTECHSELTLWQLINAFNGTLYDATTSLK